MTTASALRLAPGDDLRGALERWAREHNVRAAYVATCVGSVQRAAIRFAGAAQAQVCEGPFEIVGLVGTLSPDGAHLHIALADANGKTLGGHLALGTPIHTTAEIVVVELADTAFARELDPATGYRELVIRPAPNSSGG